MISLNGMELDQYLQVPDLYTDAGALGNERLTLGGSLVVQRLVSSSVAQLTLTAVRDGNGLYGRFLRSQVQAIRALADTGTAVPFIYNGFTCSVVVALDGVNLEMIGHRTDPPADHPYIGTVLLLRA